MHKHDDNDNKLQDVLREGVEEIFADETGRSLESGSRSIFNEVTAVNIRNRHLRAVTGESVDPSLATTGVWETRGNGAAVSEEARTVRTLGRMLLSACGTDDLSSLRDRIQIILERRFERSVDFIHPEQWGSVIRAVEWIAEESLQYRDVVRLLLALSELPAPLHLRVTLKLRASFYLEHRLGDSVRAVEAALEAHALSPLSTQTTGIVCEKIRDISERVAPDSSLGYWKRMVQRYLDVLAAEDIDRDKQVAVLLMLGWIFCDGMDDVEQGCRCLERARRLDPENRTVADKLAVLESKCVARTEARRAKENLVRPPAGCPPVPPAKKKFPFIA